MGSFFSMDSKFFSFMSKVADLMILNIICMICCIPIVTAGASLTALYYVTLKMVKNEESYIIKSFFKSFKENFKQSTIITLIVIVLGVIFYFDFNIMNAVGGGGVFKVLMYIIFAMMVMFMLTALYIFPVLSKFDNTIKNTIKNSFFMAIRHLPWTALLVLITALPIVFLMFVPSIALLVIILGGFSLVAYANSFIFNKVFANYIPDEENEDGQKELEENNE